MAESPSHKFGQIVGNLLEDIMLPVLRSFCAARGLYLDSKGKRPRVRKGRKVTWRDKYGNDHDLDFVIEKDGSSERRGRPVAFIETAWRRYTRHSRNKAQEIQGAVLPIADEYRWDRPFLGTVLAGVFTKGSLDQLESVGFRVLHFPYDSVVAAFASVGIDARFDETTPDGTFTRCIAQIEALDEAAYEKLKGYLVREKKALFDAFLAELAQVLDRKVERLVVMPLHGSEFAFDSVTRTARFIEQSDNAGTGGAFRKYEIVVRYSNGETIDVSFRSKAEAARFLRHLGA